MIVPSYWSEAKRRIELPSGSSLTLRRFGWSDLSEEDATRIAEERLDVACTAALAGEKVSQRDRKVPYLGSDGVPIREEIVDRFGDHILTRNVYGALCLNTPNVLFADVDAEDLVPAGNVCLGFFFLVGVSVLLKWVMGGWYAFFIGAGLYAAYLLLLFYIRRRTFSSLPNRVRQKLAGYCEQHPNSLLRLYETPAGFRILLMHQEMDPAGEEAQEFMKAFSSDQIYMTMCRRQACFRARVTPKPWRVGLTEHLKPRPGVWPIQKERMPDRIRWVKEYEEKIRGYAACRFLAEFGRGQACSTAQTVMELHDRLCRSGSGDPIA